MATAPSDHQARALPRVTLADLAREGVSQLEARYRDGRVPVDLAALDGSPPGLMLAVVGLERAAVSPLLRRIAAARAFVWDGKDFSARGGERGSGINRVRWFGGRRMFPFETRIEDSVVDGRPCVLLDYDRPENPWFIRRIRDELREVSPGLFLGPALFRTRGSHRLMLFFACDNTGA